MPTLPEFMRKIEAASQVFKIAAWTLFALLGPLMFLVMHNYLGMAMSGGIALLIAAILYAPQRSAVRFRRELRAALLVQGLCVGAYGVYGLTSSTAPWRHVAASTRTALALEPRSGAVYAIEFTEHSPGFFFLGEGAPDWKREAFAGAYVSEIGVSLDGSRVFAPEGRSDLLWVRERGRWKSLGGYAGIHSFAGNLAAMQGRLVRVGGDAIAGVAPVTGVCAEGGGVVAFRSSKAVEGKSRLWRSADAGVTFTEESLPDMGSDRCALSGDGTAWVAGAGVFFGDLVRVSPGALPHRVAAPGPRIEALAVNPADSREAWVALWGSGVFRTVDGGESWQTFGLRGSEVNDLVVDFNRRRAFASTGSGIYERTW